MKSGHGPDHLLMATHRKTRLTGRVFLFWLLARIPWLAELQILVLLRLGFQHPKQTFVPSFVVFRLIHQMKLPWGLRGLFC